MLVLIWVQTVCRGYQQTKKVGASKERVDIRPYRPQREKACLREGSKELTQLQRLARILKKCMQQVEL